MAARPLAIVAAFAGTPLCAHTGGQPPRPGELWTAWSLQPEVVLPLVLAAAVYARGVQLAWRKAGRDRGIRTWRAAAFFGGLLALVAALVAPLDALGESLFSAHMGQHILLMGVAAPLLVLGEPVPAALRTVPRHWQRRLAALAAAPAWRAGWAWLASALVAALLQTILFLVWHAPPAIALSLRSEVVHALMHGSLLGGALLFWTAVVRLRGAGFGAALLGLLLTFKVSLILGALLAFAPRGFYPAYDGRSEAWGLTLLEDQQLAGLLMMSVGSMMYVAAALVLVAVRLNEPEGRGGDRLAPEQGAAGAPGAPAPGQGGAGAADGLAAGQAGAADADRSAPGRQLAPAAGGGLRGLAGAQGDATG